MSPDQLRQGVLCAGVPGFFGLIMHYCMEKFAAPAQAPRFAGRSLFESLSLWRLPVFLSFEIILVDFLSYCNYILFVMLSA